MLNLNKTSNKTLKLMWKKKKKLRCTTVKGLKLLIVTTTSL